VLQTEKLAVDYCESITIYEVTHFEALVLFYPSAANGPLHDHRSLSSDAIQQSRMYTHKYS